MISHIDKIQTNNIWQIDEMSRNIFFIYEVNFFGEYYITKIRELTNEKIPFYYYRINLYFINGNFSANTKLL